MYRRFLWAYLVFANLQVQGPQSCAPGRADGFPNWSWSAANVWSIRASQFPGHGNLLKSEEMTQSKSGQCNHTTLEVLVLSVTLEITVLENDDSSCLYREPRNKVSHWTRAEPRNARKKFFRSCLSFQSSWTHKLKLSNWSVFVFTQHILS